MGMLSSTQTRGKEIFSFEYEKAWLANHQALQIDPDLHLYAGPQYATEDKRNFGIFLDSSPDRWGRLLMRRREAALARREDRKEVMLQESDYLLGVYDTSRMGAIRFKLDHNGPFLNDNESMSIPPWAFLRKLEQASLQLEGIDVTEDREYLNWLNMLFAPGSSLGGSRPKASVADTKNSLWIAKFPSRSDDHDVGGWEMVVNSLASEAQLNVAESKAEKFGSKYHTFLTRRFDRVNSNRRIHFASAMTLLGYQDGNNFQDGVSYLQLVEFISRNGARVEKDLEELWRRIVFNICIKNTDDHLRNHGFLLTPNGWILSPAYDMNPVATGTGLSLNITENDNALDLDLAMDVIEYFNIKEGKAIKIIKTVVDSVNNWQTIAKNYKINKSELEIMSRAFSTRPSNPKLPQKEILCSAIKKRQRISFRYKDKQRIGEPQCCGVSSGGKEVVRVHLLKGGRRPEQLFLIDQIKSLKVLGEHFTKPGPNYQPDDQAMKEIYCQL
jgi:serine/threonine-protein kinase HipA